MEKFSTQFTAFWAVVLGAAFVATALHRLIWSQQNHNDATVVPGLPLIGNALALGRHGVSYINKCRRKFGDSFTLSLAGVKMTFFFEPSHIDYFFSAPEEKITFRPAVEQFTQRVFGLTSRLFFPLHFKMLTDLRHLLVPAALTEHMQTLGTRALQLLPCYVHHAQVDLYSLCRGLVFHCAVEMMFGRSFVDQLPELLHFPRRRHQQHDEGGEPGGQEAVWAEGQQQQEQHLEFQGGASSFKSSTGEAALSPGAALVTASAVWETFPAEGPQQQAARPRPPSGVQRLARTFYTFEECFEMAASPLPHAFQTEFLESRAELLRVFREADRRGLFKDTPAGELLNRTTGLPSHLRPHLLLAIMWASQANTIPAAFWSTAFLLLPENAVHKAAVIEELQRELQSTLLSPGGSEAASVNGVAGSRTATVDAATVASEGSSKPSNPDLVAAATRLAANRRSAVSRCVAEALRLRVQSIDVRQAASQLDLPSDTSPGARLRLPRGRLLAICPFESHHDRKLWGASAEPSGRAINPWVFDPTRPEMRLCDGSAVLSSGAGLAFGGGPYRCPGRFFAEQELGLLVQLFLWSYDMTLSYGDTDSRSAGEPTAAKVMTTQGTAPIAAAAATSDGQGGPTRLHGSKEAPGPGPGPGEASEVDPYPQLRDIQGGSLLYSVMATLLGPSAMAWGFGWFDGLDGPMQEWRESGDPAGLLPPCDLRRLVGVKVPRKPCWVQLGRPMRSTTQQRMFT